MIGWLIEVLTYGAIGALIGATWITQHNIENAKPCVSRHEHNLSPHEQQPEPIPAVMQVGFYIESFIL